MNNIILAQSEKLTMSSGDLYDIVCRARLELGETQPRLNDFHARVVDELEGDHYETFVVQNSNNTQSTYFNLTIDQCTLVGMRESKSVRRAVLSKINKLDSKEEFYIPQTYGAALQLCADQAKQLELAAPKIAFVENLVERSTLMTATQIAQKHKMSAIKLNRFLDELGGVYSKNVKRGRAFIQSFIDNGHGEVKQTELGHSQCLFTPLGEVWINEKLITEGEV